MLSGCTAPHFTPFLQHSKLSPNISFSPPAPSPLSLYESSDPLYQRFQVTHSTHTSYTKKIQTTQIYLQFPPVATNTKNLDNLLKSSPQYVISFKDTPENQMAQHLQNLFQKRQYGKLLIHYKSFVDTYKNSEYGEIVHHLAADTHYRIFHRSGNINDFNKAKKIYAQIEKMYPKSKFIDRNDLILSYTHLKLKNGLEALRHLTRLRERNKNLTEISFIELPLAQSYLLLNKPETALSIYKKRPLSTRSNTHSEALHGIGDSYYQMKNWKHSIAAYRKALSTYPQFSSQFPRSHYYIAESLFFEGQYKKSLNNYIDFIHLFPSHSHNGYALLRISEILEILGESKEKSLGALLECQFKIKGHPSSEVAKMILLSESLTTTKNSKFQRILNEIEIITHRSPLPEIQNFMDFRIAKSLQDRGDYKLAIYHLQKAFRNNDSTDQREVLLKKIAENVALDMQNQFDQKKIDASIQVYKKNSPWIKEFTIDTRIALQIFLSHIYLENENLKKASRILDEVEIQLSKNFPTHSVRDEIDPNPLKRDFLKARAAHHLKSNKQLEAFNIYKRILKEFESPQEPMNSLRYQAGQISLSLGRTQEAQEIWSRFKGKDKGWYQLLMREKLNHTQWMKKYKEHIQLAMQI